MNYINKITDKFKKVSVKEVRSKYSDYSKWGNLRAIQSNKVIKSTYVWIIIVPITAKLFSKIEEQVVFIISGNEYIIDLQLPFSWQYFFLSALCFVIANMFFLLYAPKIIKDYKNYGEFNQNGESSTYLYSYMWSEYDVLVKKRQKEEKDRYEQIHPEYRSKPEYKELSSYEKGQERNEKFWKIYNFYNVKKPLIRTTCSIFYIFGFVLFFYVVASNIYWAVSYMLNN